MSNLHYFSLLTVLLFSLVWIGLILYFRLKKRAPLPRLFFYSLFYVYLIKVLDYTLLQFQSLLLLKRFVPTLILNGQTTRESLNLLPLITLTSYDVKTSLLNILLFVPFGFGLSFLTNYRMRQVVAMGAAFSIAIELLQLITGLIGKITFRVADVNDVIFNTIGTAIGCVVFVGFTHGYRRLTSRSIGYHDAPDHPHSQIQDNSE